MEAKKTSGNFPNFKSLAGEGSVTQTLSVEGASTVEATLEAVSKLNIGNEKLCYGLTLKIKETEIVTVLTCESGQTIFCPGEIKYCGNDYYTPTKVKNNVLERRGQGSKEKYTLELLPDGLVYRRLERNCLIPYPHGCIIPGFGWHDYKVYEFHK